MRRASFSSPGDGSVRKGLSVVSLSVDQTLHELARWPLAMD